MKRFLFWMLFPLLLLAQDHLLITEVLIPPSSEAEKAFVEIYNPTTQALSLDQVYVANYNTYYEMVNEAYSQNSAHFLARFPNVQIAAGQSMVVAIDGNGYKNSFGKQPDFEILDSDGTIENMNNLYAGSNPVFEFTRGMLIVFSWDGTNDLVADIDYMPWGIIPFASFWMDKSGLQIDGPDNGSEVSTYANDLTRSIQKAWNAPSGGFSLQRNGITESDEVSSGGNGVNGHNEATENWKDSFEAAAPTPGSFSETAGDGSGMVSASPDTLDISSVADITFSVTGSPDFDLASLELTVPESWQWSGSESDVSISGGGLSGAAISVNGKTVLIEQAQISDTQTGSITLKSLTAADVGGSYGFEIKTAVSGGQLTPIAVFPVVFLLQPIAIAEIQNNSGEFVDQVVTVQAVVTIGAGVTNNTRTDAYVQDESGRGINLNAEGLEFPDLQRGNRLAITGKVSNYTDSNGDVTTQIVDFQAQLLSTDNEIPAVPVLSTAAAGNTGLEGTMVETAGIITDLFVFDDANANITIDDGSGELGMRIWNTTGIDVSMYTVGDTLGIRAVIDQYRGAAQMLVGYQDDMFLTGLPETADGTGLITVSPDSVGTAEIVDLDFTVDATSSDTLAQMEITVPGYWGWSNSAADVNLDGALGSGQITVTGKKISLADLTLTDGESGKVTISGLTAPDADTASAFIFKTASKFGSLRNVKNQPVVLVGKGTAATTITIEEARQQPVGSKVAVMGVISMGSGILRTNFNDAYIHDESGYGINVYGSGSLDPDLTRGNLVVMKGEIDEYQGKMEIVDYSLTVLKTGVEIPAVRELSTYEASTTEFEGSFCEISGSITNKSSDAQGSNVYLNDGSGSVTVRVWNTTGVDINSFGVGEFVVVRGIVGTYNNAGQVLLGYQEDIFRPQFDGSPVFLKVENKPFVPDRGEKIKIEFSSGAQNSHITMRIFDMAGRVVATLMDGSGLPFPVEKEWDGRDQLNEYVPLGTYICHLKVVDEDSGKKTSKLAPIVVGTVLK